MNEDNHQSDTQQSSNSDILIPSRSSLLCAASAVNVSELWQKIHAEAEEICIHEPELQSLLHDVVIRLPDLASSLACRLSRKLAREDMTKQQLMPLLSEVLHANPAIVASAARDLLAICERDAACDSPLIPLLYFKGFCAITTYRISHALWHAGRKHLALYFQSLSSEVFSVDIHPAARIGCGILLDHATSLVIGETAIVEDDVSILHEVTLGGTGKVCGDRHPIIRTGVLIGAGAKILGRVEVGAGAKIGAGSVVLNDVPAHKTVAGVPAIVVGVARQDAPALDMDQQL
jgi:serine O-acetyltransferase